MTPEQITAAIRDAFHEAGVAARISAEMASDPSVLYRPRIFIDGDQWCALYGENLQDGVAGFGKSPQEAMNDFNKNWHAKLEYPR